jgi:epoxide hydrolase 4
VIRHETVDAGGTRLHVALAGERGRPLLLCLHGFPECWYSWRRQLEGLSDRFFVAAPDLRGYGGSDKPKDVASYRVDALAGDVAALVRALGYERAMLAGHDWGGAVAWHTATVHPERVERLAILNCPHPMLFLERIRLGDLAQVKRSLYMLAFQVPVLPERLFPPARLARVMRHTAAKREVFTREDVAEYEKALTGSVSGGLAYYRAMFRELLSPWRRGKLLASWRRGVQAPTLIVWGEKDPFLGTDLVGGHEALTHGGLALRRIHGAGHWVQQEAPDEVNEALAGFFIAP